ncbi:alpha/beta hydrolase [Natrononativus amylolyticus]|uniref:alpha/beta hydrolase n=1 Tax=Natrononativus amylolyticus TaxID=2963434 RepID=UPI0020CC5E3B|nr:phospholipase [Natrononativus amylolyticus]
MSVDPDARDPHGEQELLISGAPAGAAEVAVVALHGRGATAQGVTNLFEPLYRRGVAVFAPAAERGRWYPRAADAPLEANEPWLTSAVDAVARALEAAADVGIPPERTLLVGFSQGASVAAEAALRNPMRYGGLGILSGTVLGPEPAARTIDAPGSLEGTPVLLAAGEDDPHVDVDRFRATGRLLEGLGGNVTELRTPEAGHAVSEAAFAALANRVERLLADA